MNPICKKDPLGIGNRKVFAMDYGTILRRAEQRTLDLLEKIREIDGFKEEDLGILEIKDLTNYPDDVATGEDVEL